MPRAKLEIQSNGPTLMHSKVLINGEEVTGLTSLTVRMNMMDATMATFTIGVEEVKIDAETLTKLEAHMDAKQRAAIMDSSDNVTFDEIRRR